MSQAKAARKETNKANSVTVAAAINVINVTVLSELSRKS